MDHFNPYTINSEHCPQCNELELSYFMQCSGVHCQNCGAWFEPDKTLVKED